MTEMITFKIKLQMEMRMKLQKAVEFLVLWSTFYHRVIRLQRDDA
jgi:hypothetical protein